MDLPANGYLTSFCSGNGDGERLHAMLDYVGKNWADATSGKVFSLESGESLGKAVVLTSE